MSSDFIFVLGDGQGYSIENFVLSPIAITGMLIHYHGNTGKYEFLNGLTFYEFCNIDNEQRQEISNAICKYIEEKIKADLKRKAIDRKYPIVSFTEQQVETSTLNGEKIFLPKWILETRGHDLEKIVLVTFQELALYGRENEAGKLMKSIFTHVYAQVPNLISTSMVDTFKKLIN